MAQNTCFSWMLNHFSSAEINSYLDNINAIKMMAQQVD